MPATVQPVIVTPSIPLLLAFYKALLGAVEISRVPEDGPAFFVGLQIGNAELGVVADGDAHIDAPQRILLNVNVSDLGVGNVAGLLDHVEALGGRVLGPPNEMPWGSAWRTSRTRTGTRSTSPSPSRTVARGWSPRYPMPDVAETRCSWNMRGSLPLGLSNAVTCHLALAISAVAMSREHICSGQTSCGSPVPVNSSLSISDQARDTPRFPGKCQCPLLI